MSRRKSSLLGPKKFQLKLKKHTVYSIAALLLWTLAGLIWLSFFKKGVLLFEINSLLVGQLGLIPVFFMPFPLIVGGLMISKTKISLAQPHVFVGSLVILTGLTGLVHQGSLGKQIWDNIAVFVSGFGAFLFLSIGIIIGTIVMLNIPFEDVFAAIGKLFTKSPSVGNKSLDKVSKLPLSKPLQPDKSLKPQDIKISGLSDQPNSPKKPSSADAIVQPKVPNAASDKPWHYPPLSLLSENSSGKADRGNVNENAATIEKTLEAFGIIAKVVEINRGPAVTQYALQVAIGTKLSKINALGSDLALALAAPTGQIRIEAPIPGRSLVGIEVPNRSAEFVNLRKVLEDNTIKNFKSKLAVAMGLDVSGQVVAADIAKMPHVLIAGATGSGKSVCINAFLATLLFRCSPQELNLILVDPKRVELTGYNGIPHLLTPVIVEPDKVLSALKWATHEMDRRYKIFSEVGVRNLEAYNELSGFQALPYIVIFIDELADIMLFAQVEVEDAITRIAQMARATGIHLVLATQRPSVDIITGLIKANIPTRVAFAVSSMIDSKVILDSPGAEKLLGKGDMLYVPPDQAKPSRIQGAFVSDKEIRALIDYLKKQGVEPQYTAEVLTQPISSKRGRSSAGSAFISPNGESRDELFADALRVIIQNNNASASFLQRKLEIGYARAAKILDQMQNAGVIGASNGAKPRDILIQDAEAFLNGGTNPAPEPTS